MSALAAFTLTLTGYVPVICRVEGQQYFCNDPAGFVLYQDGQPIVFAGPARGTLPGKLVIVQRQVRP